MTNAYCKVRHYAGKADELMQKGAVVYQMATPLVAAAVLSSDGREGSNNSKQSAALAYIDKEFTAFTNESTSARAATSRDSTCF